MIRPSGAYKLLATLLYGVADRVTEVSYEGLDAPLMRWVRDGNVKAYLEVPSVRRLGRLLGVESRKINMWLIWLYEQGLIENVQWSTDKRSVTVILTKPRNI